MLSKRDLLAGGGALLALMTAPARAGDKKPTILQIPFSPGPGDGPVVDLFFGEKGPYRFFIDTGASGAAINESLAKTLKLPPIGTEGGAGLTGASDRHFIYTARHVRLGGVLALPAIDMSGWAKPMSDGRDGLLPASLLTGAPSELDYEGALVRYYLNGAPMDLTGFVKLDTASQADYGGGTAGGAEKIYVRVKLDGRELLCIVDTGSPPGLVLSGAYVQSHGLWSKYPDAVDSRLAGVDGGVMKTRIVKIPDFEFGAVHFDGIWVELGDPGSHDMLLGMGVDGIIGVDILRQFTLAFAERHDVYIKPNSRFSPQAGARSRAHKTFDARQPVLPLRYSDDRRVQITAQAGGKAVVCLINTGVTESAVAPMAAQALGLASAGGGFDGSALALDGLWHPAHLPLAARPALAGRPAAVDLGLDFLTAQACRIDFDVNEMTIFPAEPPDLTGYNLFATRAAGGAGRFLVTAKLAGADTVCLIDTAVQPAVVLTPRAVMARNLWDAFPDAESRKGLSGETRLVKMRGLDVAGLHRDETPVQLSDPTMASGADMPYVAWLGMDFLHRCNWIFTPDGKLYAKPNGFWTG